MEPVYQRVLERGERVAFAEGSNALDDGVHTSRRKGSRDNIVAWTPRLREAWDAAVERRRLISEKRTPVPIVPKRRLLFVGESGGAISAHAIQEACASTMRRATEAGTRPAKRFAAHGGKHKDISDSPGNRHDKQQAQDIAASG